MNRMETVKRLKPCPFCGGKANVKEELNLTKMTGNFFVSCDNCGAQTEKIGLSPEYSAYQILLDKWNRRNTELAPDGTPSIITNPNKIELSSGSCFSTITSETEELKL